MTLSKDVSRSCEWWGYERSVTVSSRRRGPRVVLVTAYLPLSVPRCGPRVQDIPRVLGHLPPVPSSRFFDFFG